MSKNLNLSSLNKLSINYATLSNQKFSGPNLINYNNKIDESFLCAFFITIYYTMLFF